MNRNLHSIISFLSLKKPRINTLPSMQATVTKYHRSTKTKQKNFHHPVKQWFSKCSPQNSVTGTTNHWVPTHTGYIRNSGAREDQHLFQWALRACVPSAKAHLALCDPMGCSPPAPPSMGFSRQEYWSGLPLPSPGDPPYQGIKPTSPVSPSFAGGFFITEPPGKPLIRGLSHSRVCLIERGDSRPGAGAYDMSSDISSRQKERLHQRLHVQIQRSQESTWISFSLPKDRTIRISKIVTMN